MALTHDSIADTVRRKARRAQNNVKAAEEELVAANQALKNALKDAAPSPDVEVIAHAAERTVVAEEEVHQAAHELDVVNELLVEDATAPQRESAPAGSASGEGLRSLLPRLKRRD